jgi:hypothetical protein
MDGLLSDWLSQMGANCQFKHRVDIGTTYSFFILHITMRCKVETQCDAAGCRSTASLLYTSDFMLHLARGDPSKLSPFGLEGLEEDRGCMRM